MSEAPEKEKQFDTYITVRCSEATRDALANSAKGDRRSLSNYIRMVLEDHVDQAKRSAHEAEPEAA